ncbi:AraC family transcriptional regulator [Massilioclostridium coli]|uniref:AraC family transcriptional regulator n=1 Tax=Massilioclostridium coli TaxID=1870991 RepID=UPI00085C6E55|nr:AraC family transcriptional regulator [Massilioclostridium coli]PWM99328.1 MAG: AraC family transcriptional regulator [Massilioclostridium sp.]PWN00365.1 MAG: AraC family transcriptional regulator [Massilioclostridium sp.]
MAINMHTYIQLAHKQMDQYHIRFSKQTPDERNTIKQQNLSRGYHTIEDSQWFVHGLEAIVTLHDYRYTNTNHGYPHNHDFFEMSYVYQGNFYNQINQEQEIIQPSNTLALLSPNAIHSCCIKKETDIVFNILMKRSLVEEIFLRMLSENTILFRFFMDSIYNVHQNQSYLMFQCNDHLTNLVQEIIQEHFDQKEFKETIIVAKLIQLFAELSRIYSQQIEQFQTLSRHDKNTKEMMDYIQKNYATISLESLSEAFHYSTEYTSRTIKKQTGQTFSNIIRQIRLEKSCYYLANSDLPVEQIVEIIGYHDIRHFYKIFKKEYQLSPIQYREQARKNGFFLPKQPAFEAIAE